MARAILHDILTQAVEDNDTIALKRLSELVVRYGQSRQEPGEMSEYTVLPNTSEVRTELDTLGISHRIVTRESLEVDVARAVAHAMRHLAFIRDLQKRSELPTLVAEGDSWFLHNGLKDTLDHLHDRFNIRSLAAPGDAAWDMLCTDEHIALIAELDAPVLLFSGGANDLLGGGRIARVALPEDPVLDPEDLVNEPYYSSQIERVGGLYERMISHLHQRAPRVQIVSHGYDHVVNVTKGAWIWPFLKDLRYSEQRACALVGVLLDRFNDLLSGLERRYPNFCYVDMRGVVGSSKQSWHDAIHPKSAGYQRVAERFALIVQSVLDQQPQREQPMPTATNTNEALLGSVNSRTLKAALTDFERVRAVANAITEDRSSWRTFSDPLVHEHIEAVLRLLKGTDDSAADEQERLRNRLETRPAALVESANSSSVGRGVFETSDPRSLVEAIFGESEIEPVQILLQGYRASRAVGRVKVMSVSRMHIGHGSGLLVAPGLFLTNHHVLRSADEAARSLLVFDDEISVDGALRGPKQFRVTGDIYAASPETDYAFVSVESVNSDGDSLADYGSLQLLEPSAKAVNFEPVSIVQHPRGNSKAIAIRNSFVIGRVGDGVYYTADTEGGSSGSAVFNREWQVVALHHRFVPHPMERDGVLANRGVRISSIFQDLFKRQNAGEAMAAWVLQILAADRNGGRFETYNQPDREFNLLESRVDSAPAPSEEIDDGVYAGLTMDEFFVAIADEDDDPGDIDDIPVPEELAEYEQWDDEEAGLERLPTDRASVLRRVGKRGYKFIIGHEVSSKANYDRRLKNPIRPGGQSGVTIGIGYDLGHQSLSGFRKHWDGLLDTSTMRRLEACIGLKGSAAQAKLSSVKHIVIPYDKAITVFERDSLPRFFGHLNRHVNDQVLDDLVPDCVAALVSLTFNRGASYGKSGSRYEEMRAIKAALNGGNHDVVPTQLRSMKRLWQGRPNLRGLLRRRDEEAELFEDGLKLMRSGGGFSGGSTGGSSGGGGGQDDGVEWDPTPDLDEESTLEQPFPTAEARRTWRSGDVRWVNTYSNNPDYAHLPGATQGEDFELTPRLIEQAIELGHYRPHFTNEEHLIIAVRGVRIASGDTSIIRASRIDLMEQKPNHRHFRCVIGVYHRDDQRISVFQASTVPNRGGVAVYASGGANCNMLPTGCYQLCVGTHHGKTHKVPTVLRLGKGPEPDAALKVTTLRSRNDPIYGTADLWDPCKPADNIHPAFSASSADFSSLGCLTVPGRYSNGRHQGLWSNFRATAGFDDSRHRGTRYDLLLTSGMELAAIAAATDTSGLKRLAHGSRGNEVEALQRHLGTGVDGDFGPTTKERLTQAESNANNGKATGIYSMETQRLLRFDVFG